MALGLFLHLPAHGHVNPTLAVMRELVRRGHRIVAFATPEFRAKIERTGAEYRSYAGIGDEAAATIARNTDNPLRIAAAIMEASERILPELLSAMDELGPQSPAFVVHDSMATWGWCAARVRGLPAVTTNSIFVYDRVPVSGRFALQLLGLAVASVPALVRYRRSARRIRVAYGVAPPGIAHAFNLPAKLAVVFTSRTLQPRADAIGDEYVFVGPSIERTPTPDDGLVEAARGRRSVYLAMGTILTDQLPLYRACIRAFGESDLRVVMSVGSDENARRLGAVPSNVVVRARVPQLAVLAHTDVFITHGGMNSVHESLSSGVPMVVIPQTHEQGVVARQVASLGAGVVLSAGRVTPRRLRRAAERLLADSSYRERCRELGRDFRSAGGYTRAADVIVEHARVR